MPVVVEAIDELGRWVVGIVVLTWVLFLGPCSTGWTPEERIASLEDRAARAEHRLEELETDVGNVWAWTKVVCGKAQTAYRMVLGGDARDDAGECPE